jgi:CubicO group peptidase (beta-lactamase class C family)
MKDQLIATFLSLTLIICWSGISAQQPTAFSVNGKKIDARQFDGKVNHLLTETGVPAMSLAIIEDNKIVYYKNYGYKKITTKEKVDSTTIFEACSLSKSFLVFAAYRLVDEGKLDLHKPMYQYLEHPRLAHDPRYKLITPMMILNHSSGIENWAMFNNPDTLEILSDPGTKYVYSGEGYEYLARVMESILHKSYRTYISEMVFEPLQLKNTYASYSSGGKFPSDYATGHSLFQKVFDKWKNDSTGPAAGIHTTAKDYATLLLSVFNKKYLSDSSLKLILTPGIRRGNPRVSRYFNTGFEALYTPNDTIISHSGDNRGFKNLMFYSVTKKRGIVFLTNSDMGIRLGRELCGMSVGLDVSPYFSDYYEQYPSPAIRLAKIYREKGKAAMFAALEELENAPKDRIAAKSIDDLGQLFYDEDKTIARKLLQDNIRLYPNSPRSYFTLGEMEMEEKNYKTAYEYFLKAKTLNIDDGDLEDNLAKCKNGLAL